MLKLITLMIAFCSVTISAQDTLIRFPKSDTIYYRQLPNGLKAEYRYTNKVMQSKSFYFRQNLLSAYRVEVKSGTEISITPWYFNDSIFNLFKSYADTASKTSLKKYPESEVAIFIGSEYGFQEFLENNLNYPDAARDKKKKGIAMVEFAVSKEGVIRFIECPSSIDPLLVKEALRVINLSDGYWVPKRLHVRCRIPITFELD